MKLHLLNTLLAAGVLLCGASASADELILARHAQTLAVLSADMEEAFRDDLREMHKHYPPSRAEMGFREALCQLSDISGQFRRSVLLCAPACDLERGFASMQQAFACVSECSCNVRVCTEIRGMMQRFSQTMNCVQAAGFQVVPQRGLEPHHHHQYFDDSDEGRIQFRVPLPQGLPFVFRQPMH
ncbi:MAG TPA: hypothetical protein VLE43_15190 [Candidatus Saccharimonadia bacterium]|nr:hypothetical protein [Candidatus Saccharimonadia bacterium]